MQEKIIERRMNVAGGVAYQFGEIAARQKQTDCLVVPQTVCAETIEAEREAAQEDQIRYEATQSKLEHRAVILA